MRWCAMGPIKAGDTFLSVLFLTLIWISLAGGQIPKSGLKYCTETSPLDTKYFVPFYESHVPVVGCVARKRSTKPSGYEVHVIRINTTSKEVMMHFNENDLSSQGLILVLDSATTVRWRLSFLGTESSSSYKRVLFLSPNSSVHSSNAAIASYGNLEQLKVSRMTPDAQFANIATLNWGGLTTFSRIKGGNRISISMPKASTLPSTCLVGDSTKSSMGTSVLAYLVTKQTMSGCFHPQVAGESPSDVYVIDLASADPEAEAVNFNTSHNENDLAHLPAVYISLSPDQTGSSFETSVWQNLTLILKSRLPVRWNLESWGLSGNLAAISDNGPVENYGLSPNQNLHIVRRPLPDAFDQLWKSVVADTGSTPVSYIKLELANVLSMVIPSKPKRGLSTNISKLELSAQLVPDASDIFTGESTQENGHSAAKVETILVPPPPRKPYPEWKRFREVVNTLASSMVKKCTNAQLIIVTLPLAVTDLYNVTGMRYQQHRCNGAKNETHWILQTQGTSCGGISYFTNNNPIVRNYVHLKFAAGSDLSELSELFEFRIPIACKFPSGLSGLGTNDDDNDEFDDYEEDITLDRIGNNWDYDGDDHKPANSDGREGEMYLMRVFRSSPAPPALLMEHPGESATIIVGDKIKVETDFETRAFFSLSVEQCWLSDGSDLRVGAQGPQTPDDPRWLIRQNCPSSKNVSMYLTAATHYPTFSFKVSEEHYKMKKFYIVCLMGLCTPMGFASEGNIGQCSDPLKCSIPSNNDDHVGPVAQQMSQRGPFFVIDKRDALEMSQRDGPQTSHNNEQETSHFNSNKPSIPNTDNWQQQEYRQLNDNVDQNNQTGAGLAEETPSLHSSHVVMVGVSAEIAVVIALASFIIGAALTGLLCCVHHRRTMPKSNFHLRVRGLNDPAEGAELQSMIASPTVLQNQQQPISRMVTT